MECDRLRGENASLQNERDVLDEFADELLPSAAYCDTILQCKNALPISIIAGSYGMSAVVFNRLLRELKIQRKVRGVWILYSKYKSNGYTALRTCSAGGERSVTFTCWTQRGRKFIYDTLKQHGLVPQIEKMYENFI
jgi:phage antirepressor YoqD-like protein